MSSIINRCGLMPDAFDYKPTGPYTVILSDQFERRTKRKSNIVNACRRLFEYDHEGDTLRMVIDGRGYVIFWTRERAGVVEMCAVGSVWRALELLIDQGDLTEEQSMDLLASEVVARTAWPEVPA